VVGPLTLYPKEMNEETDVSDETELDPSLQAAFDAAAKGDTLDKDSSNSPDPVVGHEETKNDTGKDVATNPIKEEDKTSDKEPDVETLKREYGKLKQTQEEFKKVQDSVKEKDELLQFYEGFVTESEKRYRSALSKKGATPDQVEQIVGQLKANNPELWGQAQTPPSKNDTSADIQRLINEHPDIQFAKGQREAADAQRVEQRKERDTLFASFEAERPDIYENRSPEDASSIRNSIGTISQSMQNTHKMEEKAALDYAYNAVLHPEKLREEGRMEGYFQAINRQSGISSSPGVSSPTKSSVDTSSLTQFEREVAKETGLSPEDYLKWKRKS